MSDLTPFDRYQLTEFEQITSKVRRVTPIQALYAWAEEQLLVERPEGFTPEDIGRKAWAALPEAEREDAMAELLYTFWEALEADKATHGRIEQSGGAA